FALLALCLHAALPILLYGCPQTLNGFLNRYDLTNTGCPGAKWKLTTASILRAGLFNGQDCLQFRQESIHSSLPVHTELVCLKSRSEEHTSELQSRFDL